MTIRSISQVQRTSYNSQLTFDIEKKLFLHRQRVNVHGKSGGRRTDLGGHSIRNQPWTSTASARRHSDVLPSIDTEGNRESLNRRCKFLRPKYLAVLHVKCLDLLIAISDKTHTACRR